MNRVKKGEGTELPEQRQSVGLNMSNRGRSPWLPKKGEGTELPEQRQSVGLSMSNRGRSPWLPKKLRSQSVRLNFTCIVAVAMLVCASCADHVAQGDEYFAQASQKASQDSIIQAYSLAEKALDAYSKSEDVGRQNKARIFLSLLYYSTGQKDMAYHTIENMGNAKFAEEDYPLYSNYYRIKAQHISTSGKNKQEAINLMDSVLYFDNLYAKDNLNIINLDRLNKCEILLNVGETNPIPQLLDSVKSSIVSPSPLESQLYANMARWFESVQKPDSAYAYAKLVVDKTSKIYEDVDNSIYAFNVILRYDSLQNNLGEYIQYRNLLEKYKDEIQGERVKYGMAFAKEQNKNEKLQMQAKAEKTAWILISISIFLVTFIFLLVLIQKHKNVLIKNKMTQLECDRLDAEAFRRKLENELLTRKINSKSGELKKANDEILELSRQLAQNKAAAVPDNDASYLQRLLNTVQNDHPDFMRRVNEQYPYITKTESILACLIKLNLSSEEITTAMSISKSGLIKARYRLRKKLSIESSAELDDFIAHI